MTTSSVTEYENTGATIVSKAFRHVRVSQKGQALQPDDAEFGLSALNDIVKSWQRDGLHLWKNKEAAVFLEPQRRTYTLGNQSTIGCDDDGCNADDIDGQMVYATSGDWVLTSLTAAATAGDSTVNIASLLSYAGVTYNTSCEMNIGIENINGGINWYSIADVDLITLDVLIADVLLVDVAEDATVYIYRAADQLEKPLKIYQENVRLLQVNSQYELPISLMAWTDYNLLPQKDVQGVPVQAFYEPKINNSELAVWPTAQDVNNVLLFRFGSPLQIFESDTDTQDFPSEWIRPLTWALASELGPSYGLPLPRQQALDARASSLKDAVEDWDQDNNSMFIYPRSWGQM
jgi:hypothetical protein